jgi:hypothetical protein
MNKYKKHHVETNESYSNEQFESLAESKTLSGAAADDKVNCFMCKQVIPRG